MNAPKETDRLPARLCRFRSFGSPHSNGRDKAAVFDLLRGRFRFTPINKFNDPFEGRPRHVPAFDNAGAQRKALLKYLTEICPTQVGLSARKKWAEKQLAGKDIMEFSREMCRLSSSAVPVEKISVLCMAHHEAAAAPLPWSHYADSHKGVCIAFDTSHVPLKFAYEVTYSDDYPMLPVPRTEHHQWDAISKAYLRKCRHWEYEREHRVIRIDLPDAAMSHHLMVDWEGDIAIADPAIAKSITFGVRMEVNEQTELVEWIRANAPHVEMFKADLHESRYEIVVTPL
jgi:hypothetical protein